MLDATPKHFSTMNSTSEQNNRDYAGLNILNGRPAVDKNGEVFVNNLHLHVCSKTKKKLSIHLQHSPAAKQRLILAAWLRGIFPGLNLPINACDEDLKACLLDANVLSQILNRLKKPSSAKEKEVLSYWFSLCSTSCGSLQVLLSYHVHCYEYQFSDTRVVMLSIIWLHGRRRSRGSLQLYPTWG